MIARTGKRLIDFTQDDYRNSAPLLGGIRDPFSLTIEHIFLSYHQRHNKNAQAQWLSATGHNPNLQPLSDADFVDRYGPPPWQLLNQALAVIGLDYAFVPPEGPEEDLPYEARLIHTYTDATVAPSELSSGEQTLLALAITVYSSGRPSEAVDLPRVLLLDEADASLHPSMAGGLLRMVDELFCQAHGIMAILTTHSPSTVALAPESSLYTMRRSGNPRLQRASRDGALASLTVGVPTLSIRNDNRRQVFVESEHDEACYQALFLALRQRISSPLSLEFIAAGKRDQGGGSQAVRRLVQDLRAAGNASVWGIVDRDDRKGAPDHILHNPNRYALENLVLDPLPLGAFLIREGIVKPELMLLPEGLLHFQLRTEHAQAVCDFVCSRVVSTDDQKRETAEVSYAGGFTARVSSWYLTVNGHLLEETILDVFRPLRGQRNLKLAVIQRAIRELPEFAPHDVVALFEHVSTG